MHVSITFSLVFQNNIFIPNPLPAAGLPNLAPTKNYRSVTWGLVYHRCRLSLFYFFIRRCAATVKVRVYRTFTI